MENQEEYYKLKYEKYKKKYLQKKNLTGGANTRHNCEPNNDFKNICVENNSGMYKSKETCINDCENKYINIQLVKANIKHETHKFYLFIKDLIKNEKIDVYIKGGNVIGLYILKMIYQKYKDDEKNFEKYFNKFLDLELIKDWDFSSYTKSNITEEYRNHLDEVAKKYKLVPRAKTFILYQTKKPILTEDKALFEISILEPDRFSKLEIPMTTMKVKVTEYNLKYIYMFAKSFLSYKLKKEPFDFDIIKRMIEKMNIIIHPHKNGLYDPGNKFDTGDLNKHLVNFILDYSKKDKKIAQFLSIHIEDPFRLLYRLPDKNIPKTEKIKKFIKENLNNKMPSWILDTKKISNIVKDFCEKLGLELKKIYKKGKSMNKVIDFISGINFGRTQIEFCNLSDKNKKILKSILEPLVKTAEINNINQLEETDKFITFLKFLISKDFFN
jgi:hypothetical protein